MPSSAPLDNEDDYPKRVDALCHLLIRDDGPVHINLQADTEQLMDVGRQDASAYAFMPKEAESLASVLQHYSLSDRGKIRLAHCLSWAVWQYYDSKWMCHRWTSDEVHFIPPDGKDDLNFHQGSLDAMSPHVKVNFGSENSEPETLHFEYTRRRLLHPAPRIHALGVMLANIFGQSIERDNANPVAFYNRQYIYYGSKLPEDWPQFEAKSSRLPAIIRNVVLACFDKTLSGTAESSIAERRKYLFNKIVWPLKYLAVEIYPAARASWYPNDTRIPHDTTTNDEHASKRHRSGASWSTPPDTSRSSKTGSGIESRTLRTEGKARRADSPVSSTVSGTFGVKYVRNILECT